jgi:hypothetical protein
MRPDGGLAFVIPAEAGIHLLLHFDCGRLREDRLTSVCGTSAIPGGRSLSLACPRESNQREGHPRGRGHAGIPARVTTQARSGGLLTGHPWPAANACASCARPCGLFPARACRGREGTRESKAKARQSLPQKRLCSALDLGSLCDAAEGGRIRPRVSAGGAMDRAAFAAGHGWPVGKTPAARSEPFAQRRALHRGCVLFGYFLLHKQEKVTRPPGWRTEQHRDVSRFSRKRPKQNRAVGQGPPYELESDPAARGGRKNTGT